MEPMVASERHAAQWRHWIHPQTQLTEPPYENLHCCFICRCDFTFFVRRHHCRSCGRTVCSDHSDNFAPVTALEIEEDDREEETMQLRKLGSMKRRFDDLMEKYANGLEEKNRKEIRKNHIALLHGFIDGQLRKNSNS